MDVAIVWFRRDLRLADHAALSAAVSGGGPIVAAFVLPSDTPHGPGERSLGWMRRSLESLDRSLRERGAGLVVRSGPAEDALVRLASEVGARTAHCQRDWSPEGMAEEERVRDALAERGVELRVAEGQLLVTPPELTTGAGGPYRVFTPFYRAWRRSWQAEPALEVPVRIAEPPGAALASEDKGFSAGAGGLGGSWEAGERAARARLDEFLAQPIRDYAEDRDRPGVRGTSELSPRLAWGELSPRQVAAAAVRSAGDAAEPFVRQLAWREFAYHVLHHYPHTAEQPLRAQFSAFPWCDDPEGLAAWKAGRTGYPIVDAGMRQLAETGWMHNRVRLVCGSFLTKDLLIPWQVGEAHFRQALADYDPAANVFNWQWVAGSGADAAPYFRIFNPMIQGARFDPDGVYASTWIPELAGLPNRWLHQPWQAPGVVLEKAGVVLGETYPRPVVDHFEARDRALAAFAALKEASPPLV